MDGKPEKKPKGKRKTKTVVEELQEETQCPPSPSVNTSNNGNDSQPLNIDASVGHIIVQLPLSSEKVEKLLNEETAATTVTQQNVDIDILRNTREEVIPPEPSAYEPSNNYESEPANNENGSGYQKCGQTETNVTCCYWCCNPIDHMNVALPIWYDVLNSSFLTMGNFCSYECAVAYNFQAHQGTDKMWEIHTWLEYLAEKSGIEPPLRPAPSRYTLKMFGGPLSIHEFRTIHRTGTRLVLCNIPPLVSVFPQTEVLNTSYMCSHIDPERLQEAHERLKVKRKILDGNNSWQQQQRKTLDSKMKLSFLDNPVSTPNTIPIPVAGS